MRELVIVVSSVIAVDITSVIVLILAVFRLVLSIIVLLVVEGRSVALFPSVLGHRVAVVSKVV